MGGHRTESVSLSGRLIHPFADEFFVQWPQAARGAVCATRGPFCDTRNAWLRLDRSEPPGAARTACEPASARAITDAAAPLLPRLDRGEPRPARGRRRGDILRVRRAAHARRLRQREDSRQLSPAGAPACRRERRAWTLVVPPALFGLLGFAIHLPVAGYPRYCYPVLPIVLWMAVLGMSARSEHWQTGPT